MLLQVVRILLVLVIAKLWERGGQDKGKWYRTVVIPLILAAFFALTKAWWLAPVMFVVCQAVRIGYGNYMDDGDDCWLAELLKDRDGWWIRMCWGLLVSIAISYPFGLCWWYILTFTIVNFLVSRLKITLPWADYIVGGTLGGILWLT